MIRGGLGFLGTIVFTIGCKQPTQPVNEIQPTAKEEVVSKLTNEMSNAEFHFTVDSIYLKTWLDTSSYWQSIAQSPNERTLPSEKGVGPGPKQPVLSYKHMKDVWLVRWINEDLISHIVLVYKGRCVYQNEHCFNDQWSRCGVGFDRDTYWRGDTIFDRSYRTAWTTDSVEWHSDACNCLSLIETISPNEIVSKLPSEVRGKMGVAN